MDARQTAYNLVQASLLLDEEQKAEICALLAYDGVSEDYLVQVLQILGVEQEEVGRAVAEMSDEAILQLAQAISASQSQSTRVTATQESEESAEQAEALLEPVTSTL